MKIAKITDAWKILWFLLIGVGLGCGEDVSRDTNLAPRILTFEAESDVVAPGAAVAIRLVTGDLENDVLSYTWSVTGGELTENASGAVWRAPETERKYQIEVTVSDGENTTRSVLDIQVWRTRPGNYYPLAVGNTWHYRDENDSEIIFQIIDTIQIQRAGGKTIESFVLQKSSTNAGLENIVNYSYLGPLFDEKGEISGIVQHAQNTTSGTGDTILFEPFLPLYQFPLIPGEKWDVSFQAKLVPELFPLGDGLDEFEVLSEETVTVPVGTFEHVFQVQESFWWGFDIGNQDFPLDITVVKKWIAPDVGIVKFTQSQTRGDETVETVFELESFKLMNN
ncbi:MAG: hypothetical protein OXU51_14285 [Candidatus Poribacteria bacterium]|nr:hypothetical protein [Candidatus Poribacteria bacterium]